MTLAELLSAVKRHLKLTIALPVLAAVLMAIIAWGFMANTYTASTTLYVLSQTTSENNASLNYSDLTASQLVTNDVAELIQSDRVSRDAAESLNLEDLSDYKISVDSQTTTRVVKVSVSGKQQNMVAAVANAIAKATDSAAQEEMGVESINVFDEAQTPEKASGPNRTLYTLVALLAGLFIAIAIVVLIEMLHPVIQETQDAADLLETSVLGRIPAIKRKNELFDDPKAKTAAKTLFANIRFMGDEDNPVKAIVVTSTMPAEGKTTTSVRLARAIAQSGKTCLLVESDFRHRSVALTLGVRTTGGLVGVVNGTTPLNKAIVALPTKGMYFLDVEPNAADLDDVISSARYEKLVASLRDKFDYVIFDAPPVGAFVEAALLSKMTDGVVMVVRNGVVPRAALIEAHKQLENADAKLLGVCGTYCESATAAYGYGYGYGYGYYDYYSKNERGSRSESSDSARYSSRSSRSDSSSQSGSRSSSRRSSSPRH